MLRSLSYLLLAFLSINIATAQKTLTVRDIWYSPAFSADSCDV